MCGKFLRSLRSQSLILGTPEGLHHGETLSHLASTFGFAGMKKAAYSGFVQYLAEAVR